MCETSINIRRATFSDVSDIMAMIQVSCNYNDVFNCQIKLKCSGARRF